MTKDLVADIAEQACAAHKRGATHLFVGGQDFDLVTGGYCARFVRQCHEVALGVPAFSWRYAAPNAIEMEKNLASIKVPTNPERGDIMCMNHNNGKYGHIGIYDGEGYVCENTSSTVRGPGTVRSRITDGMLLHLTGYYSVLPKAVIDVIQPWAREAVKWAMENGLTDGTDLTIEMQRDIVMLYRYHTKFGPGAMRK